MMSFPGTVTAPTPNAAFALIRRAVREKAGWVVTASISNALSALSEGGTFGVMLVALQLLVDPASQQLIISRAPTEWLRGWIGTLDRNALFAVLIVAAVTLQGLRSLLAGLGATATVMVGSHLQGLVQRTVYAQVMRLSFPCVSRYKVGDLTDMVTTPAVTTNDIVNIANDIGINLLTVLVYSALMFSISVPLTLVSLMVFAAAGFAQKGLVGRIRRHSVRLSNAGAKLSRQLVESIQSLRVTHTFHRQAEAVEEVDRTIGEITALSRHMGRIVAALGPLSQTLTVASVGAFLIVGVFVLQGRGGSTVPELITFTVILNRLATRANVLPASAAEIAKRMGQLARLDAILREDDKEFLSEDGDQFVELQGSIEFREVALRYTERDSDALRGVSFTIPVGRVTAVVGASGSGKSTIVDLLLRLYEPTSGRICVDGVPITRYSIASWRRAFGVVSQDTVLFNTTVTENIRLGRATASHEAAREAARIANAVDFITDLPQGFDTVLGERGYGLSGGQRQRIALARAVLRNPTILVLDEATSALDSVSERAIQTELEAFGRNRTVLVIAHRLSTVRHADQIVLIEDGAIVETGTHETLIARDGPYAHYWRLQSSQPVAEAV